MVSRTKRGQLLGEAFAVITLAVLMSPWVISLYQTPIYEATIKMLVGQRSTEDTCFRLQRSTEDTCFRLLGVDVGDPQDETLTVADVADTMPVAKAVVEQVKLPELSTRGVLANMTAEPDPGTLFVNISYEDSDPKRAQLIANTIGQVVSDKASKVSVSANAITATVWAPATLPKNPREPRSGTQHASSVGNLGIAVGAANHRESFARESYSAATEERISRVHGRVPRGRQGARTAGGAGTSRGADGGGGCPRDLAHGGGGRAAAL